METEFKIHPVLEKAYCCPTVLMLLTGQTKAMVHAKIHTLRNRLGHGKFKRCKTDPNKFIKRKFELTDQVRGVAAHIMERLLKEYGFQPHEFNNPHMTLESFQADAAHITKPIVINVTRHYVLLYKGMVYDTFKKEGCPVAEHPYARKRIAKYWILRQLPTSF